MLARSCNRVPRRALHMQSAPAARAAPAAAAKSARAANIGEFLDRRAAQYEWRDAFRDAKSNIRWTYKELQTQISGYACGFNSLPGGMRGHKILALTGNAPETLVTLLAAARVGAASSVLDASVAEEVSPAIEAAKAKVLIMPGSFDKELLRLIPEFTHHLYRGGEMPLGPVQSRRHPSLKMVLSLQWNVGANTGPVPLRETFWHNPVPNPLPALTASLAPSLTALWETLRGGATVAYSHAGLLGQAEALAEALALRTEDRTLNALHYSSAAATTVSLAAWLKGGALVSSGPEPRDPLLALKALSTEHATVFVAPAELYAAVAAHPALAKHAVNPLRVAVVVAEAGKAPSAAEAERIAKVFTAEQYLLASTVAEAGIALVRPLLGVDASELGAPLAGAEGRVANGELSVRTPQALHRVALSGSSDEWTPTALRVSPRNGGFALV